MIARFWNDARARRVMLGVAGVAALTLVATGCASSSDAGKTDAPAGDGLFDQGLHDLLPEGIQKSGTISFGALWETPPTISIDEADPTKPAGITPDLAALFGEILGVDVEWQNLAWPAQLPGLQSGSVDVLFGQVSITEEREQSVVDLIPFQKRTYGMLVPDGNPAGAERLADMCGLTIGVPIGSKQAERVTAISDAECVAKGESAIKMNEYQGAAAAIQALRAGTVDGWLDASPNIISMATSEDAAFDGIELPTDEIAVEYTGIAVAKDNPGLTEALVGAMRLIIENGDYAKVYESFDVKTEDMALTEVVANPLTGTPAGEMAG